MELCSISIAYDKWFSSFGLFSQETHHWLHATQFIVLNWCKLLLYFYQGSRLAVTDVCTHWKNNVRHKARILCTIDLYTYSYKRILKVLKKERAHHACATLLSGNRQIPSWKKHAIWGRQFGCCVYHLSPLANQSTHHKNHGFHEEVFRRKQWLEKCNNPVIHRLSCTVFSWQSATFVVGGIWH